MTVPFKFINERVLHIYIVYPDSDTIVQTNKDPFCPLLYALVIQIDDI